MAYDTELVAAVCIRAGANFVYIPVMLSSGDAESSSQDVLNEPARDHGIDVACAVTGDNALDFRLEFLRRFFINEIHSAADGVAPV